MLKQLLLLTSFFQLHTSLIAMDLNETTIIINEATEATETLQGEFNQLINEKPSLTPVLEPKIDTTVNTLENNISMVKELKPVENNASVVQELTKPELKPLEENASIEVTELNSSTKKFIIPEVNSTISTPSETNLSKELNTSILDSDCVDSNDSVPSTETNSSNESNSSEPVLNCSGEEIHGDTMKGRLIYKTRIKPYCEITGETFAKQYMQEDWDDIHSENEFKMEVIKACPKMKTRYREKWTPHIYQFVLEYASDSDAIPEC